MPTRKALRKLHDEVVSALQVAVAGRARDDLIEELAATAGLLEALAGLGPHPMGAVAVERAKRSLTAWAAWQRVGSRSVVGA